MRFFLEGISGERENRIERKGNLEVGHFSAEECNNKKFFPQLMERKRHYLDGEVVSPKD
jgi:uncharacterized protein (DUF927 family)